MSSSLLTTRRFAPLFWCQFFSAFNDNFLKNSLVFLILFKMAGQDSEALITLAGAIFIFPFFILSAIGGEIADRYDKAFVAQRLKLIEIAVAAIAVLGFWLHSVPVLFAALFLFGVISALFGPIKYGILPDHLAESELPAGNALVEGATFIAILSGTIVGGLASKGGGDPASFAGMMMAFALACWIAALFIPATGEGRAEPRHRFQHRALDLRRAARPLRPEAAVVGRAGGELVLARRHHRAVPAAATGQERAGRIGGGRHRLSRRSSRSRIAIGSGLASWLASGRIVLIPTVFAGVLLGVFALHLGWITQGLTATEQGRGVGEVLGAGPGLFIGIDLAGLAVAGGLFIVPAFSAVQAWSGSDRRARMVAAVNVLNAAFMTVGGIGVAVLQKYGVTLSTLFVAIGAANLLVAVAILYTMPTSPMRDLLSVIFRAFYRLEVSGLDNVAKAGPNAIIALNHVSFLDAAVALSFLDREPVFAIDSTIAQRWWVKPFLHFTRAMPLDPTKPLATRTLIHSVKAGNPLIIFPEGRITVTGSLMKVYDGAAMIADKSEAMLVPVRIKGLEKTHFSRLDRSQVRRSLFPKVTVTILEPLRLSVDPALRGKRRRMAAGALLYTVMSDLIFRTTSTDRTIVEAVIAAAAGHDKKHVAVEDPIGGSLTYKRLLLGAAVLGRKLMPLAATGEAVGVMLPNANGAVVAILALMSAGRVPAMINFTSGLMNLRAACKAANIRTIVTSRTFVEKAHLEKLVEGLTPEVAFTYLEDVRAQVTFIDKLRGLREAKRPLVRRTPDDPAAILFTSGSEGTPKGVVLSNRNMLANAAQAEARIDFGRADKVFNVLPLFHSFGLTVGLVLPLVSGVGVYLYPSPLHYRIIPEMIYGTNATILFGTDTFLAGYARAAHSYDFRSLRYILAGAEPVKETTRRTFMEKFGLRILEGYGVTETAPALALNTPMFNKFGSVGRLLTGHGGAARPGSRRRGGRAPVRARPQCHAGLSARRKPGRAGTPGARLARHRRHRRDRRRRFHQH